MAQIFVSYRRADSDVIAGRIRDRLANSFGEKSIFMDVDSIPFGADFRSHVKDVLSRGDVLIAVIGPKWMGLDDNGKSRFDDEADPVRLEIEAALQKKMPIIPVLVQGASMPAPNQLPPSFKDFAFYNAAEVDVGRDFHPHLDRLIRSINLLLKRQPNSRYTVWAAAGGVLVGIAAAIVFALSQTGYLSTAYAPAIKNPALDARPTQQASRSKFETQDSWSLDRSIALAELETTANKLSVNSRRVKTITGYLAVGSERYAVLWERGDNQSNVAGWGYDAANYSRRQDELTKSGRRPIFLSAHEVDNGVRFADVWTSTGSTQWELKRDLSAESLRAAVSESSLRGLYPAHVYGYAASGKPQFVAIFERQTGEQNILSIDTPGAETQKDWDSKISQGYRPKSISGYRVSNSDYLTTLWEKGRIASSQFGVAEKNVDSVIEQRKSQGLKLIYLSAYAGLGGTRYNLIWDHQ